MRRPRILIRSLLCVTIIAAGAALFQPIAVADGRSVHRCRSADLRYPFRPGGPKTFGVFALRIAHGRCATAHRVAKRWMHRFEANIRRGRLRLPHEVYGFTFKTLRAREAQTYRERGRRRATTIRFDYRVPNG